MSYLKHTALLLGGLTVLALTAAPVHAQFADEFTGSTLGPAWSFSVPGNYPVDSSDPSHYSLKDGMLHITLQPGNLRYVYIRNLPSVTLAAGPSADYTITTSVSASFDKVENYPHAGLVVFSRASNYIQFCVRHNNFEHNNYNFPVVMSDIGGKPDAYQKTAEMSSDYTNIGSGATPQPVILTITKTGSAITFTCTPGGGVAHTVCTLSATDTGDKKAAYDFLSSMSGKQVGLYTDTDYTKDTETVSFDYLHLTGLNPAKN